MLAPFLVVLSALPASGGTSRVDLSTGLTLDAGALNNPVAFNGAGGWLGGDVTLGATVFGRLVKDDDAPPALQPFLQRTPRYSLQVIGGGESIRTGTLISGPNFETFEPTDSWSRFDTSLSASGYVSWVFLSGGLELDYRTWHYVSYSSTSFAHDASEFLAHPWLEVGGRWRDLLLSAGWGVWPVLGKDGSTSVRFWGTAFFGAQAVIRRFVDLSVSLDVLEGGAVIHGDVAVWLRRRFALSAGLNGGRGAFVNRSALYDRAGGVAGLTYWFTPRVALSITYAPSWLHTVDAPPFGPFDRSSVQHLLTVTALWRPAISRALPSRDDELDEP